VFLSRLVERIEKGSNLNFQDIWSITREVIVDFLCKKMDEFFLNVSIFIISFGYDGQRKLPLCF
jgi:hypothetical protein